MPRRTGRSVSFGLVSVLVAGAVAAGVVAENQSAAAVSGGILQPGFGVSGVTAYGEVWLGAMQAPRGYGDDVVFCVKAGGDSPAGVAAIGEDQITDPQLADAMARHRWEGDPVTRAALAYLAHVRWEEGSNGVSASARVAAFAAHTRRDVVARADALLAESAATAGPYAPAAPQPAGAGTRTGNVHGIGVRNGSGGWVPGLGFTATIAGPAVFDSSGSAKLDGSTGTGPLTVGWTATGTGAVTVTITYRDIPRVTLTRVRGSGNVQTVVTYGHRDLAVDASVVAPPPVTFQVVGRFQPVATTAVRSRVVAVGDALVDTVTVGAAAGDSWLTVQGRPVPVTFAGTAYSTGLQPARVAPTAPADATVVGTASLTVTGPGTYTASVPGVGTGQFVTWVWRMVVADQPEPWRPYLRGNWQDSFGRPAETASVRHRASVASQVVVRADEDGRAAGLADDVTVTGFPVDHPEFAGGAGFTADRPTIVQSLWYFPEGVAVTDANRDRATLLGQVELTATNGTRTAVGDGAFALPRTATGAGLAGTYVFTHAFAGDDRVEPFETSVTVASEQFVLEPRPLAVATTAVADRAPVIGDQVVAHDVATVTGDIPVGATIAFELYEWAAGGTPLCSEPVWTSPELTLTAEGEIASPPGDVAALAGDLGFVAVVRDAGGEALSRGECGEQGETLPSGTYEVATAAAADRAVVLGDAVAAGDTAEATGTIPTAATLTFELYTWPAGEEPVCEEPIWRSEPVVFAAGTTTSPRVPVDRVLGDLGFVAVVHGTDGRELSRGACGDTAETLVAGTYEVTTTAGTDRPAVFGDAVMVHDVARAVGTIPTDATLTFELYTWPVGEEPVCEEALWRSDPVAFAGGTTRSPDVSVDPVTGDLGFVEVVHGVDGRELSRGACGAPGETVGADVLTVTTTARSTGRLVLGSAAEVWDEAVVHGTAAPGTTVTVELYTWTGEPRCVAPLWTSEPVTLDGRGENSSARTAVPEVTGSLGFVAVARGADGRVLSRGACGEETETLTAAPRALALTGSGTWPLVAVAGGVLALGAAAVTAARRRGEAR